MAEMYTFGIDINFGGKTRCNNPFSAGVYCCLCVGFSAVPSGPPTSFITNATDSRTITLSWGTPQADEQNGILRYYLVTLTSVLPTETRNISSSQFSITISNLRPYTTYSCTVRAGTVGIGPPTIVQQILTPEDGMICN